MPEVTYTTTLPIPRDRLWDFVQDVENWAPMMTGYVSHQVVDERNTTWVLRGDVGVLSREVKLAVEVTRWDGPDQVDFALTGINEAVSGGGSFLLADAEDAVGEPAAAGPPPAPPARGWLQQLLDRVFRALFRRAHGETAAPQLPAAMASATSLTFIWRMEAGGPMGPLVNAMLAPALAPAAEELAHRIAAHLTSQEAP